jgi:hypothetical protein
LVIATQESKKKKPPQGSAQALEKARFGQENPRKSKPFSLILFSPGLVGFCWIWLDLALAWREKRTVNGDD